MANQRFTLQFDFQANIGPVKNAITELQKNLGSLNLPTNMQTGFDKLFSKLATEINDFEALTKKSFTNMSDVNKAQASFGKIQKLLNQLSIESSKIKGIDPNKLLPAEVARRVENLTNKLAALQAQSEKKDKFAEKIKNQNKAIQEQQREVNKLQTKREALTKENQSMGAQKGAQESRKKAAQKELDEALAARTALEGKKGGKSSAEYAALGQEITRLGKVISTADTEIARLTTNINKNKTAIISLDGNISTATTSLNDMQNELAEMQSFDINTEELTALRQELAQILGLNINEISTDLDKIKEAITGIPNSHLEKIATGVKKVDNSLDNIDEAANGAANGMRDVVDAGQGLDRAAQDMENLKNQVYQFFSMTNSIQLFKRAISSAMNTVKELDATMTEAAVVTDFSVGDMWNKLPEYSAQAQKLGVSINGMYQATTLYYQQGLKTNEAMALGVETMKMAKIAGMESAQATEAMTAALRGFNMELNEASATQVNDVYSKLAAITAADTEQIATAMSKTASIAAGANMEFETTAALLSQIIETTQEAPETAGTALKTIIARFSEVKKLQNEGISSGQDSEGEDIDVNKIQTALRTVGISMEGFFAGTEGLDSVLLKLAGKWDTLDFQTQRYIATMAAGSRQQSRFIAMMSDYGRTTELVNAANNSAGASQEQFNKTLESMDSKLQKLENAWNEFLMGLSNNEILKGAIDTLTFFVEGINKITDAISGGNGLIKSVTSLITVVGALKLGKSLLDTGLGYVGGKMGMPGQKQSVVETITRETKTDGSIVETIVRNPQQQGEQSGEKAGTGFVAGFKRAVSKDAKGMRLESMFTTGPAKAADKIAVKSSRLRDNAVKKKHEKRATSALKQKYSDKNIGIDNARDGFLEEIRNINKGQFNDAQLNQVAAAYDEVYKATGDVSQAMDAASTKTQKLNGTLMNSTQTADMMAEQTNGLSLNMGALGSAVMGAGAALGGLSMLFESLGMEEEAEIVSILASVFMGLGTVMTTLSIIAPMLGISFTTAGIQIKIAGDQITTAGVNSQLAWWWVFAIIGAIAALIILFAVLAKKTKAASIEGRMEAAAKATEEAKKAAEEAKQAYDDLLSDKSEYDELQDRLENLTKGTQEWKEALIEANNKVLELIQNYPELAQYVELGKNGALEISEDNWNKIEQEKKQNAKVAQDMALSSQINETVLKAEKAKSDLISNLIREDNYLQDYWTYNVDEGVTDAFGNTTYTQYSTSLEEAFNKLYEKYSKDPSLFTKSQIGENADQLFKEVGLVEEQILSMIPALQQYDMALKQNEIQLEAQVKALMSGYVSEDLKEYEYGNQIISVVSQGYMKNQKEIIENTKGKLDKEEDVTAYGKEKGLTDAQLSGNKNADLQAIYAKMAGLSSVDQIDKTLKDNNDKLIEEIAKLEVAKQAGENAQEIYSHLSGLEDIKQKYYTAILSGNFENLTQEDIDAITATTIGDMAASMDMELSKLTEIMGTTVEELSNRRMNLVEMAKKQRKEMSDSFQTIGANLDNFDFTKVLTSSALTGLKDNMIKVFTATGTEGVNTIMEILDEVAPIQKQKFVEAISSIDWSSVESIDNLDKIFADFNISVNTEQFEQLKQTMKECAKATAAWDLEALKDQLKEVEDMLDQLSDRQSNERIFTQKQIEMLIKENPELKTEFVMTGIDEFTYIGESMDVLTSAVNDLVKVLIREQQGAIIERAEVSSKWLESAQGEPMANYIARIIEEKREIGAVELGNLNHFFMEIGLTTMEMSAEQMALALPGIYKQYYGLMGNVAKDNIEKAKTVDLYEDLVYTTQQSGIGILNAGDDVEKQNAALDAQISKNLALAEAKKLLEKNTKTNTKDSEVYDRHLKALAIDTYKIEQATKAMCETTEDNYEALEDGIQAIKAGKQPTADYYDAINQISLSAQNVFGEVATAEFVNNNRNLFAQLIKGGMEGQVAFDELRKKIKEATLNKVNIKFEEHGLEEFEQEISVLISEIENDLQKGVEPDFSKLIDSLRVAKFETNEIKTILENISGLSIEISTGSDYETKSISYEEYTKNPSKYIGWENITQDYDLLTSAPEFYSKDKQVTLKRKKDIITSTSHPTNPYSAFTPSNQGDTNIWKNPYDRFYNKIEEINDELREREQIERRYQNLLEQEDLTATEINKKNKEALKNLAAEKDLREELIKGRKQEINDILNQYKNLHKYATIETNPFTGDPEVRIDYNEINKITSEDQGAQIEEYISLLETAVDSINSERDAIDDIKDYTKEIMKRGKDEYFSLEQQIKDALVGEKEREIQELQTISETINDTNSRIFDAIQKSIEDVRQQRENEKTEKEIANNERKLMYLRQDTSGMNALEILELQKSIDEQKQDYTDTLIDQKINELQEQNDLAAEQRERQIEILEEQKKQWIESGAIWEQVYEILQNGTDSDGGLLNGSRLEEILKNQENFTGMSTLSKMEWLKTLETTVAQAVSYLQSGRQLEMLAKEGETIDFKTVDGITISGSVDKDGNVTSQGKTYKEIYQGADGKFYTSERHQGQDNIEGTGNEDDDMTEILPEEPPMTSKNTSENIEGIAEAIWNWGSISGWGNGTERVNNINNKIGPGAAAKVQEVIDQIRAGKRTGVWSRAEQSKKYFISQFKTGGLADFTGPAWLDGTKSKPEYILNADQTKAFFQLVDVLSSLRTGEAKTTQNNGDNIYDIDINVESIGSDYDVEQIASTVKRLINDDARYRNNNTVNLMR